MERELIPMTKVHEFQSKFTRDISVNAQQDI